MSGEFASLRYRAVFLSDIHLGTPASQAERLLDFLRRVNCEQLYLVGDIVDGWRMKRRGFHWPQAHNDVVQKLLRLARKGVAVTYLPGNHDDRLRDFCGVHFGGVVVADEAVHRTADGRRFWVVHGDAFDPSVRHGALLASAGDLTYRTVRRLDMSLGAVRRLFGADPWSLATFLKTHVSAAAAYIDGFERAAAAEAGRRGFDGVICGHIHKAALRQIGDVTYVNDGDWVDSCTALVEREDGTLEILDWARQRSWFMMGPARRMGGEPTFLPEPSLA